MKAKKENSPKESPEMSSNLWDLCLMIIKGNFMAEKSMVSEQSTQTWHQNKQTNKQTNNTNQTFE